MPAPELTVEVHLRPEERRAMLVDDARRGLTSTPKRISPVWFYDDRGSRLFDEITRLPEYYLTRAERRLLAGHGNEMASVARADTLVELGSGTSDKTRLLLDALRREGSLLRYAPLDVSEETLRDSAAQLVDEYPGLDVHAIVGDFHAHLGELPAGERRLVAFLGSTIGNLVPAERARFLGGLAGVLGSGDHLLLGVDLVKDPARLIAAYDDSTGVTAAFNRNALRVLGSELGATVDEALFDHVAVWDPEQQWMEMSLRATVEHIVSVPGLGIDVPFRRGEQLHTEISAKFTVEGITAELGDAGLAIDRTWRDDEGYLLVLARPS